MAVEPDDRGSFIAVGSENGNTTILELSHHLIDLQRNEKNIFLSVRTISTITIHYYYCCELSTGRTSEIIFDSRQAQLSDSIPRLLVWHGRKVLVGAPTPPKLL